MTRYGETMLTFLVIAVVTVGHTVLAQTEAQRKRAKRMLLFILVAVVVAEGLDWVWPQHAQPQIVVNYTPKASAAHSLVVESLAPDQDGNK